MQIAFTGSRNGPFPPQLATLQRTLSGLIAVAREKEDRGEPLLFRHGDCVGWDAAAHDVADAAGYSQIIHPAKVPRHLRAFKPQRLDRPPLIMVLEPKPPLDRNRDMVDVSERLIACPAEKDEKFQGGTWYTVRYARKRGLDVLLIFPDGSIRVEPGIGRPLACW